MSYVGEWPWWPIQSSKKGRKKKVKGWDDREREKERDQIKFINLRFEKWEVLRFRQVLNALCIIFADVSYRC